MGIGINFAKQLKLFLMKIAVRFLLIVLPVLCITCQTYAQNQDTTKAVKVAVFIPLYADEVFEGGT
ncbi:MAG: hypothetical protein ACR2KZ_16450 [Segetibacter sp.]